MSFGVRSTANRQYAATSACIGLGYTSSADLNSVRRLFVSFGLDSVRPGRHTFVRHGLVVVIVITPVTLMTFALTELNDFANKWESHTLGLSVITTNERRRPNSDKQQEYECDNRLWRSDCLRFLAFF